MRRSRQSFTNRPSNGADFARCKQESAYPNLWPDYCWCPSVVGPCGPAKTTLRDVAGNQDGTLNNFTLTSAWVDVWQKGLTFDGVNDLVSVSGVTKPTSKLSYVMWLSTTSTTTSQQALRGADSAAGTNYGFTLSLSGITSGKYLFALKTGTDNFLEATIPDTGLHMVAATYDGATQSLYVDQSAPVTGAASGSVVYSAGSLLIGATHGSVPTLPFSGSIREVSLYSRSLSISEVRQLYALGPGGVLTPRASHQFGAATTNRRRRVLCAGAA